MKKVNLVLLFFLFSFFTSFCQDTTSYTLSGTVVNGLNNLPLSGAHLLTSNNIATKTNELGEFTINTFANDTLIISYVGFKTIKYISPYRKNGKYLLKFKMYKDSVSLEEVEIFPWPTYKEFKKAFIALDKQDEKVKIKGLNMYVDKSRTAPKPSALSPISYVYDKLFDKKAKMRRRLARRRKTIKRSKSNIE